MSSYLQLKKRAFMSIVNGVKGFVRTVSGVPPISLEDCVDSDSLIDYKIYGDSVQNGTPTPEVPVEVVSVGEYDSETGKYKVPVVARGKNLFDINNFIEVYSPYMRTALEYGYHAEVNEECLKIYGGIDADGRALFYMDGSFKENTVYTFSFDCYDALVNNAAGIYICLSYTDGTKDIVNHSRQDKVWKHFSVNSNSSKTVKGITLTYGTGSAYSYLKNIQLEKGSTATDYEPYHAPIQTNLYLDEPLRKVGDYADYVDFGKSEVVRRVFERELTKDYDYRVYKYTNTNFYGFLITFIDMKVGNRQDGFCTHLNNIPKSINSPIWFGVNEYAVYMSFPDIYNSAETHAERVTAFKAYLTAQAEAGTPVKVTYILAEETHTPISIPKLPTIKGTTIYEIGTSLNASNMEATYYSTVKGE